MSFRNFSYPAICLYFSLVNPLGKVFTSSIASSLQSCWIRSSIKLSEILKNKWSLSIMTWSIWTKENKGSDLQLNFLDFALLVISSHDLTPRDLSVRDHFLLHQTFHSWDTCTKYKHNPDLLHPNHTHKLRTSNPLPKSIQCHIYNHPHISFKFSISSVRSAMLAFKLS